MTVAKSNATIRPAIETRIAVSLSRGGIVNTGVLKEIKLDEIINPAAILPQASRLIGLTTEGLFSLIGLRGRNRGVPMQT